MTINIKLKNSSSYHFEGVTEIEKEDVIVWFWWSKNEAGWNTNAFESFWIDDIEEFMVS